MSAAAALTAALAGRYRIEQELGAGGMATVYRAYDIRHDRAVALKALRPELAAMLGSARFLNEIRVAAGLNHPHILPLFDSGEVAGTLFYTMPLVSGGSLRARLDRDGQLGLREAVALVEDMAAALDYAHGQGVIHRDIKPENILFHHGEPMLADFGIALAVTESGGARLTGSGMSVGTPQYMSPEQVGGEASINRRSDIYSLGCVLYEALAGEPPFTGRTAMAIMARQVTDPVPPITTVRPDVPVAIARAVTRALAKVPADRFDMAGDLARALAGPGHAATAEPPAAARPAVAVLPFANLSADPENEYFSDGVTDDVILQLSKVRGLKVISRTSSMRFKGAGLSLQEVGSQLGVDVILEGSVRRSANRVRIVVQLIDARADDNLWGETYDRELVDVFGIQSDVAINIVEALQARLSPTERSRIEKKPTDDVGAYDLYLLGRHHWNKRTDEGIRTAVAHFQRALALDPRFARAWAGLADAYLFAGMGYAAMPPADALPEARRAALRATELDPTLPEAHSTLGLTTLLCDWDPERAEAELRRSLALDPDHAEGHEWLGWCLAIKGEYADASVALNHALERNPLAPVLITESGWPYGYAGLHELALERYQRALAVEPDFALAQFNAGWALQRLARRGEAIAAYHTAVDRSGGAPLMQAFLASAYAEDGRREEAGEILADLMDRSRNAYGFGLPVAIAGEALGQRDLALEWLGQAFSERDPQLVGVLHREWIPLDSLRGDPRFDALLMRLPVALPAVARERERMLERKASRKPPSPVSPRAAAADAPAPSTPEARGRSVEREERVSLLVLPFDNASPDPEDEYFSDGLTDELITDLSRVRSLRVIARNSSMKFKGTARSLSAIGRQLGVRYILEGSVRRAGRDLRITTRLVDVRDETSVWAEKYAGTLENVFDFQEEVSRSIVAALNLELGRDEQRAVAGRRIPDLLAFEHYLRARRDLYTFDGASLERAIRSLNDALAILGNSVPLLRGLGMAHFQIVNVGASVDESHVLEVERNAARIREIDAAAADSYLLAGMARVLRGDFRGGVVEMRQAHARAPADPDAMLWYGVAMLSSGQPEESRKILDELVRVDPLAPVSHLLVGYRAFFQGRFEESLVPLRRSLELGPEVPVTLWCAVRMFAAAGRTDEALAAFRTLRERHPGTPFTESAGFFAAPLEGRYAEIGEPSDALRRWALRDAEWPQYLSDAFALAGRQTKSLEWLEMAVGNGFLNHDYLARHDPFLAEYRGVPEFRALLGRAERELRTFEAQLANRSSGQ